MEGWQLAYEQMITFCLDTGIVFQIRYYWEIGKAWLHSSYNIITSPAHDSATATALHAACSVTGAGYHETGKTSLGGGLYSLSDFVVLIPAFLCEQVSYFEIYMDKIRDLLDG